MKHRVKWLFVFLFQNVHEVEEDTTFMDMALRELLELKTDPDIAIAGCISTSALSQTLMVELDKAVMGKGRVFNFVVQMRVGAPAKEKRIHVLEELPSNSGLNEAATVTGIFNTIREQFEYDHVLLTTLDHGAGFSIFDPPDAPAEAPTGNGTGPAEAVEFRKQHLYSLAHRFKKKRDIAAQNTAPQKTQKAQQKAAEKKVPKKSNRTLAHMRAAVVKSAKTNAPCGLTMDSLHHAIHKTFGKVDVIFMRNCFMQMFDTGHTLREVTRFVVGFESLMWFPAYNYAYWHKAMESKGRHLDVAEVVAGAIKGLTRSRVPERMLSATALFANETAYYDELNAVMNTMIEELIFFVRGNKEKLLKCRIGIVDIVKKGYKGADFQLIDGRFWFEKVGKQLLRKNKKYQDALASFLVLHNGLVGGRSVVGKAMGGGQYRESGFSLFFPNSPENLARDGSFYSVYYTRQSSYRSQFSNHTLWPDFIAWLFLDIEPPLLRRSRS